MKKWGWSIVMPVLGVVSISDVSGANDRSLVEPWRMELYANWKQLPEPPVTPYHGPFGAAARAFTIDAENFIGQHRDVLTDAQIRNMGLRADYAKTAEQGVYDPAADPRPRNLEFEDAILDDWRRMGYNCAYAGHFQFNTFMVGSFLKEQGLLGAIAQLLFGVGGDWGIGGQRPVQFDGTERRKATMSCGSFFHPNNYESGVAAVFSMGHNYGHHLFAVGDHTLTASWDEVGLQNRSLLDYRDPMRDEFRAFLRDVWFRDVSPAVDTNGDGRTYNEFTGETLSSWDEVEPLEVSLEWAVPVWKDGKPIFSAMPDVDSRIFEQPARYVLLMAFHRYFTFEFFRRVSEDASVRMNEHGTPGRVSCYPLVNPFIVLPGANHRFVSSFYWHHRLSPVVTVRHMWPDSPKMNLNYAVSDRLAARYRNPVMGGIRLHFGPMDLEKYDGPHDINRALARMIARNVDGTHHFLYSSRFRGRDRAKRLQIAYWQNFFKTHYAGFLAHAAPIRPEIALIMPDTTGFFYRCWMYPKQDFTWTAEAFQHLQYPYDLLTEEEIELGETDLNDYKALYVVGSEWTTPAIRRRIVEFIENGGTVFANVDSLTLCVTANERTDFLKKHFGVELARKYKNAFSPSAQSVEETLWTLPFDAWDSPFKLQGHRVHDLEDPRAWARLYARTAEQYLLDEDGKPRRNREGGYPLRDPSWRMIRNADGNLTRDEAVWQQLDEKMALMPEKVRGLAQSPLDMRDPPVVRYAGMLTDAGQAISWGEIIEARTVGDARPIAWWGDKVVGIETDRTVWMGTREGMNIQALFPRVSHARATEACNPFPAAMPDSYEAFRPYSETLGYAARKAGVTRPVTISQNGTLPLNLEIQSRAASDGTLMVFVINHDKTGGMYDVAVDATLMQAVAGATAWDMLNQRVIEEGTDGHFTLAVPSWGVTVFMIGSPDRLTPLQDAQTELMAMDMSVPEYFRDRPHLNASEWFAPVPPVGE